MRLITTASRYSHYVTTGCLVVLLGSVIPSVSLAYTFTGTGCFERTAGVVRLTTPTCSATIVPDDYTENIAITFENVDPEAVVVEAGDLTVTQTASEISLTGTISASTELSIAPWFEVGDELYYVALSDNQAHGTVESNPIFEDILPLVNAIHPPFFTNAGDLVHGSDNDDTLNDMFDAVLTSLGETTIPMYPTPGNHDHDDDEGDALTMYTSHFGGTDYYYDIGPARLIALSSAGETAKGTVTDDQLEWLADTLDSTTLQTIVYFHHPLSVPSWGLTTCCFEDTTNRDAVAYTLEQHGADYVVNGHSQGYDFRFLTSSSVSSLITGLSQLISGGAGGDIAQPDGSHHFTLVHVTSGGITHQVFNLGETGLALDEANNTGGYDQATIVSEYSGMADLPYLQLKFRLRYYPESDYLITDESDNYLSFQSQPYDDRLVLLAPTSQIVNSTVTYTARVADTLHLDTVATVSPDGFMNFSIDPTLQSSDTHIAVDPTETVTIDSLAVTNDGYRWVEHAAQANSPTTYTIADLPAQTEVSVYNNAVLKERLLAGEDGIVSFTLAQRAVERAIQIRLQTVPLPNQITTIPTSGGSAHVRSFDLDGTNTANFFPYGDERSSFALLTTRLTQQSSVDYLVSNLQTNQLRLMDSSGVELDTIQATGQVHSFATKIVVQVGNQLRTYRWSANKGEFIKVNTKQFVETDLIDMVLDDVTGDGTAELVLVKQRSNQLVLQRYDWKGERWSLQHTKVLKQQGEQVQLITCQCRTRGVRDLLVVGERLQLLNKKLKVLRTVQLAGHSVINVQSGKLTDRLLDLVLIQTDTAIYPYQATGKRFKAKPPFSVGGNQMGLIYLTTRNRPSLVTVQAGLPNTVSVWHYNTADQALTQRSTFTPYATSFSGQVGVARSN